MRMRSSLVGAIGAAALLAAAAPAGANVVVGAHQHVVTTPGATVSIGPDACVKGAGTDFQNFHHNVHAGSAAAAWANPANPVSLGIAGCPAS